MGTRWKWQKIVLMAKLKTYGEQIFKEIMLYFNKLYKFMGIEMHFVCV